jgi:superfamily II DNA or RNA helicase
MFVLRDYQDLAIDKVRQAIRAGFRKILIVAPTGAGKTVIAAQIVKLAAEKARRSMFLAHRRELIYQCAGKLVDFGVDHGLLMAGEYPYGAADCQVASIQTLAARCITTDKMPLPYSDLVLIDEAHRSLAPTYITLIDHYGDKVVIGLTATPIRSDGKGLGHVYDYMVRCPSISELIRLGHLVPPVTFAPTIPDLTGVKVRGGDYDEAELQARMNRRQLVGGIIEHWHRLAHDRPSIVFASGVKHSINIRDEFHKQGIKVAHVDGDTDKRDRKAIIQDLKDDRLQVVTNYGVLVEGFDEPKLSAGIIARPTKNLGVYIQMAGRILRTCEGKVDARLIDHSGNVYEHGYVQDDHNWVLEEGRPLLSTCEERQREFDEKKPITCVKCATVYHGQLPCPTCGHIPEKKGRHIESRSGDLMELRAESRRTAKARKFTPDERELWYRSLLAIGEKKPKVTKVHGWAAHKYKTKMDEWPENWFSKKPLDEPLPEVKSWCRGMDIRYAKAMEKKREQELQ